MDHLHSYGPVDEIRVPCVLKRVQQNVVENFLQKAEICFKDFEDFPQSNSWKRREEDDVLEPDGGSNFRKLEILQAWLFFGLIAFIVRAEDAENALLSFEDLVTRHQSSRFLTTQKLPEKLQKWHDGIKNTHDKAKLHERLIDADRALEIARKVVRANFKEHSKFETKISLSGYEGNHDAPEYESNPDRDSEQLLELCLMVLGETLSAAKIHIMNDLGLRINGWFMDDDEGWGPPSYILTKMRSSNWCLRAQTVLRGQLGASSILLFAAWANHNEGYSNEKKQHANCTVSQCIYVQGQEEGQVSSSDENGSKRAEATYPPQHHGDCQQCELLGPKMSDVNSILDCADMTTEAHDFPLFRIVYEEDTSGKNGTTESRVRGITVEKWDRQDGRSLRRPSFATISHVWSQGMGNWKANSLQACQLKFIQKALEKAKIEELDGRKHDFISKLVKAALDKKCPASYRLIEEGADPEYSSSNFIERKNRAIRQIYHVFNSATCSIVIDKELCKDYAGKKPSQTLIKVLTSPWMRRLWTLQEAFLSRRLWVAFKDSGGGTVILEDVDKQIAWLELEGTSEDVNSAAFQQSMAELIKRKLYYNLMGKDREIRNRKDHPIQTRGSMVIASAWHSTRWRITSRFEDETLALSTLLNLDYRGSSIERATKIPAREKADPRLGREQKMQDFWTLIHRTYEGSIPAGLIFLPGERLSKAGFGWAPRTWMSGKDEDHPYPLTMVGKPTELHQEGLLVHYPGFLLHSGDPRVVLAANHTERKVEFPVDRHLAEWYRATVIEKDEEDRETQAAQENILRSLNLNKAPDFGIILSRPKPSEWPPEIGLLVEVYREIWRRKEPERVNKKIYCCQIIRRMQVSRIAPPSTHFSLPSGNLHDAPIGELMPEDSMWCVDGYQDIKTREQLLRPNMPKPRVKEDVVKGKLPPQNLIDAMTNLGKSQNLTVDESENLANGSVTAQREATPLGQPDTAGPMAYKQGHQQDKLDKKKWSIFGFQVG
ncbi:hypothetical protein B0O99DRAFT_675578 [Bisporella sp. PMI_857]|nr:hypothetical protein B0O99DRAFT_675578 [Bisporella sp. PMI_857]